MILSRWVRALLGNLSKCSHFNGNCEFRLKVIQNCFAGEAYLPPHKRCYSA